MENAYYPYEVAKKKNKKPIKVKEEGLYIFGGKSKGNQMSNKLKIIKIGCNPIKIM